MFLQTHFVMDTKETKMDLSEGKPRSEEFKHSLTVLRLRDRPSERNASKSRVQLSRIGELCYNELYTPSYCVSRIPFLCNDYVSISHRNLRLKPDTTEQWFTDVI